MKTKLLSVLMMIAVLALVGCNVSLKREAAQLEFQAPMNVNSSEEFHASLEVHNNGTKTFPGDESFNGVMELRNETGELRARMEIVQLHALAPGESAFATAWRSKLLPGTYQLMWGAPGHGYTTVNFSVIELNGRLYLGEEVLMTSPEGDLPVSPDHGAAQPLVDLAKANLAERLGVGLDEIAVQSVEATEFPDASLGVPEPGKMYAQVITPGYVIRLVVDGEIYEYHASNERLVFASPSSLTPAPVYRQGLDFFSTDTQEMSESEVADLGRWAETVYTWLTTCHLTVEEYPIVAADLDGPGHFEYLERIGDDILTKRQAWRGYATERWLARTNAALLPFGYRLEPHYDAEWNTTFYDLFRDDETEPMLPRLWHVWPVSVNSSGTDFCLAAENGPNASPRYLLVQADGAHPWEAGDNAYLPPVYAGDALTTVTFTGYPTITYQVRLDGQTVYTSTAVSYGAYFPLCSLTSWDGHWALEVDDHLIIDGEDLGQTMGYNSVFGFTLLHGQPFYFFQQGDTIYVSYAGQTLPYTYTKVVHNQCCEPALFNIAANGDMVWFHALKDGVWYYVEAGVYCPDSLSRQGQTVATKQYTSSDGWSFDYPANWDRVEPAFVQETLTGKTVQFRSEPTSKSELESWIESEIARKLDADEAENALVKPLVVSQKEGLTVYQYTIRSRMNSAETLLRTTVFFDGTRRYEFYTAIPPVTEEEYAAILDSFRLGDQ